MKIRISAVGLSLACGGGQLSTDQERYLELIANPEPGLESGLNSCSVLENESLSEDCRLHMLMRDAAMGGGGLAGVCEDMDTDLLRQECWFLAAEAARRENRYQLASQYCGRSGSFVDDCGQHLWQTALRRLAHRQGPPDFVAGIAGAERLYDRWYPLLSEFTDFEQRFWPRFYGNGFEGAGTVSLRWCESLEETHRLRCEAAAMEVYARELGPRLDEHGIDLCEMDMPSSDRLVSWVPAEAHPMLDAVVMERVASICGPGEAD